MLTGNYQAQLKFWITDTPQLMQASIYVISILCAEEATYAPHLLCKVHQFAL